MPPQGPPIPPNFNQSNNKNSTFTMDFTKGIASEVRTLLNDIGKLRDQRRRLEDEIAELMNMRSKFSAEGEFQPEWKPPQLEAAPPPPLAIEAPLPQAKPAWRVVDKRPVRKARTQPKESVGSLAPPMPIPEPIKNEPPAWSTWRPNALVVPTPVNGTPAPSPPPPRTGLFGPSTPPPK